MKLTLFGNAGDGVAVGGLVITQSGFETNGNFFIEISSNVAGKVVTRSSDLNGDFVAVPVVTIGENRFVISAANLSAGKEFFRVEQEQP